MTQLDQRGAHTVAALHPLTPIRYVDGQPLNGKWTGHRLDHFRVDFGTFSGLHYLLRIGYTIPFGEKDPAAFKAMFIVRVPVEKQGNNSEERAEAMRVAQTFMDMLNLRRAEI